MDPRALAFLTRHAASFIPEVAELDAAISANAVSLRSVSEGASSAQLASTYSIRSHIAERAGKDALAAKHKELSIRCQANGEGPCTIWLFSGTEYSYAAFELQPSGAIAGCYRFNGPLEEPPSGDA